MNNDGIFLGSMILVAAFMSVLTYSLGKHDGANDVCHSLCGEYYKIEQSACVCLEVKE